MSVKNYNYGTKRKAREVERLFIKKGIKKAQDVKVVCFPSAQALEIYQVFDPLGIPRENIIGIERDAEAAAYLRKAGLGIEVFEGDALEFFEKTDRAFDVISLDYDGQFRTSQRSTIAAIAMKEILKAPGILMTNFYGKREGKRAVFNYAFDFSLMQTLTDTSSVIHAPYTGEPNDLGIGRNIDEIINDPSKLMDIKDKAISSQIINLMIIGNKSPLETWRRFNPFHDRISAAVRELMTHSIQSELERLVGSDGEDAQHVNFLQERVQLLASASDEELVKRPDFYDFVFSLNASFMKYLHKIGVGRGSAGYLDSFVANRYLPQEVKRFKYTTDNGALMFLDLMRFDRVRKVLGQYHDLFVPVMDGPILKMEYRGHYCVNPRCNKNKEAKRRSMQYKSDLTRINRKMSLNNPSNLPPRISLGSSFTPKLKPTKERISQALARGLDNDGIIAEFRGLTPRRLAAYKAHITREANQEAVLNNSSRSSDSNPDRRRQTNVPQTFPKNLIPRGIYRELPEEHQMRIGYFIEEVLEPSHHIRQKHIRKAFSESNLDKLIDPNISGTRFHAFFDDVSLAIQEGKRITPEFLNSAYREIRDAESLTTVGKYINNNTKRDAAKKPTETIKSEVRELMASGIPKEEIWDTYQSHFASRQQFGAVIAWASPKLAKKRKRPES